MTGCRRGCAWCALVVIAAFALVTIGAGTAVPSPEGPRPLFGHLWALGGAWKVFVDENWSEQQQAVQTAARSGVPVLLKDNMQGWGVAAHLSLGFTGSDSAFAADESSMIQRRWQHPDGATSRMLYVPKQTDLFDRGLAIELGDVVGGRVVILAFTSTLVKIHKLAPSSLEPLGKTTAVLYPDRLAQALPQPVPAARPARKRL
jgi:hypothetical protein